jgi:hypothetical protein
LAKHPCGHSLGWPNEQSGKGGVDMKRRTLAPFIPTGFFLGYQATQTSLSGAVRAPVPIVWGITKV